DGYDNTGVSNYYFYHYDMRGSVTNIVSARKKTEGEDVSATNPVEIRLIQGYTYDVFGDTAAKKNNSFKNDVKYTGAVQDVTGLYYMNSRHYEPRKGSFLQEDSYKGEKENPKTYNLYTYCGNNPVNYTDPSGHRAFTPKEQKEYNDYLRSKGNVGVILTPKQWAKKNGFVYTEYNPNKVTVKVEQPKLGSRQVINNGNVGHVSISITQNGKETNYGFHAVDSYGTMKFLTRQSVEGYVSTVDEQTYGNRWNTEFSFNISDYEADSMRQTINSYDQNSYNGISSNCVNFAVDVLSSISINNITQPRQWDLGGYVLLVNPGYYSGYSPADMAEDLKYLQ
ncbi:RHS repeat-associated core domain-containing protein, partial [Christensenellaceae bacterium OttesenSCG-928-K19]|nr:RHS repeat-associated core domain-containing protein [Christensenellaceae bacterium OttesenSCG-928-K19]